MGKGGGSFHSIRWKGSSPLQQQQHDRSAAAQEGLLAVYLIPDWGSLHHSTTTTAATEYRKKKKRFIEIHMRVGTGGRFILVDDIGYVRILSFLSIPLGHPFPLLRREKSDALTCQTMSEREMDLNWIAPYRKWDIGWETKLSEMGKASSSSSPSDMIHFFDQVNFSCHLRGSSLLIHCTSSQPYRDIRIRYGNSFGS